MVVVAAMTVWEGGRKMAMVEEMATAAAEEADDGQGRQRCAVFSFLVRLFFFTVTATANEGRGDGAAAVVSSADPFS